jgi:Uncharacterized protein conserved in bacteria (DUF2171)
LSASRARDNAGRARPAAPSQPSFPARVRPWPLDEVKLAPDDPDAGGEPHFIPLGWVVHVEMKIHLKQPGAEAKAQWKKH